VVNPDGFPFSAKAELISSVREVCAEFFETATQYNALLERRSGIDIPNADPEIHFATSDTGLVVTSITVFRPTEDLIGTDQAITVAFFAWFKGTKLTGPAALQSTRSTRTQKAAN